MIVAPFGPLAVHAAGVVVVKVTVRPEEAVAVTANGDWAIVFAVTFAKLMVCVASVTVNDRGRSGAAL